MLRVDASWLVKHRVPLAIVVAALAAIVSAWLQQAAPDRIGDLALLSAATRGYLHGAAPYSVVGPGSPFEYPHRLLYPFTAILAFIPLAPLSPSGATIALSAFGSGAFTYAVLASARHQPALLGLASLGGVFVLLEGQWSAALCAAALMPWLGWALVIKPTTGLALFAAFPERRTALGAFAFIALSLVLVPGWPLDWWASTRSAGQVSPLVMIPGGVVVLLALIHWKHPAARLIATLALIPHTLLPYETLYLFLVPQTWLRALVLLGLSYLAPALVSTHDRMTLDYVHEYARANLWTMYVPCLAMILRPPRVSQTDADRLGAVAAIR